MTGPTFLADKSALEQVRHSEVAEARIAELIIRGVLFCTEVVALEVLHSARNLREYQTTSALLHEQRWLSLDGAASARALEVQSLLARRGQHRLAILDLLIAATAELHGATVLHHDRDFDRIASVTGQPTEWIVPAGSGFGADR